MSVTQIDHPVLGSGMSALMSGFRGLPQHDPVFFVTDFADAGDLGEYIDRYSKLLWPSPHAATDGPNMPPPSPALGSQLVKLDVPSPDEVLARLGATNRKALEEPVRHLEAILADTYPVPDGEVVTASSLSCLVKPFREYPAGTVAYSRSTTVATIVFLLPQVVLDLKTGRPEYVPRISRISRDARATFQTAIAASQRDQTEETLRRLGDISWKMAGKLCGLLPAPFGTIADASWSLLDICVNKEGEDFGALLSEAVNRINQHVTQEEIQQQTVHIQTFLEWMQVKTKILRTLGVHDSALVTADVLPTLYQHIALGSGSLLDATKQLVRHMNDEDSNRVLGRVLLGISTHLMALQWTVKLEAAVASSARQNNKDEEYNRYNQLWRAHRDELKLYLDGAEVGWIGKMRAHADGATARRLGKISGVYRYLHEWVEVIDGYGSHPIPKNHSDYGWTYHDTAINPDPLANFQVDRHKGCCNQEVVQYRAQVQQTHDRHVAAVTAELTSRYSDLRRDVATWAEGLASWNATTA